MKQIKRSELTMRELKNFKEFNNRTVMIPHQVMIFNMPDLTSIILRLNNGRIEVTDIDWLFGTIEQEFERLKPSFSRYEMEDGAIALLSEPVIKLETELLFREVCS